MLMPKRVKYRRVHRGRMKGKALKGNTLTYGDYGIQALGSCWLTANQIEAARRAMTRYIKRGGNIWIKVFPDKPVSKKPIGIRMGSGKGAPEYWVAVIKPGRVLFEMAGVPEDVAREAMRLAQHKLPIKTKFITREEFGEKDGEAVKTKEIRNLSDQDLQKQLEQSKSELFNLRFQLATGQLENPMMIGLVKKDIARIKTIIRERELNIGKEA